MNYGLRLLTVSPAVDVFLFDAYAMRNTCMYYISIVDVCFNAVGLECDSYCFHIDGKMTDESRKVLASSISLSSSPSAEG